MVAMAMADLMEAMADTMEVMEAMAMASKGLQTQSISFKFIMIFMLQLSHDSLKNSQIKVF